MFGDPRELILRDIHDYTLETVAPLGMGITGKKFSAEYIKMEGAEPGSDTMYLSMSHGDRLLFYGMDIDPPTFEELRRLVSSYEEFDDPEEDEIDEAIPGQDPVPRVTLFCRRRACKNPHELKAILSAKDDRVIDSLEHVRPTGDESNEDFFLRNAMWLLNPTVH